MTKITAAPRRRWSRFPRLELPSIHHGNASPHGPCGFEPISGDVTGFVISVGDEHTVGASAYRSTRSGSTARQRSPSRVAVLFTGSASSRGAYHVTINASEAIEAANAFRKATTIAIHNEAWAHFTEAQNQLADACKALGIPSGLTWWSTGSRPS